MALDGPGSPRRRVLLCVLWALAGTLVVMHHVLQYVSPVGPGRSAGRHVFGRTSGTKASIARRNSATIAVSDVSADVPNVGEAMAQSEPIRLLSTVATTVSSCIGNTWEDVVRFLGGLAMVAIVASAAGNFVRWNYQPSIPLTSPGVTHTVKGAVFRSVHSIASYGRFFKQKEQKAVPKTLNMMKFSQKQHTEVQQPLFEPPSFKQITSFSPVRAVKAFTQRSKHAFYDVMSTGASCGVAAVAVSKIVEAEGSSAKKKQLSTLAIGEVYRSLDSEGNAWEIQVLSNKPDGSYTAKVLDFSTHTVWDEVWAVNCEEINSFQKTATSGVKDVFNAAAAAVGAASSSTRVSQEVNTAPIHQSASIRSHVDGDGVEWAYA